MSADVGIVMKLIDKVTPGLITISNSNKAFSKSLQETEQRCAVYEKQINALTKDTATLKTSLAASNETVKAAKTAYIQYGDELSKAALTTAIEENETLKQKLKDTESATTSARKSFLSYSEGVSKGSESATKGISGLSKNLASSGLLTMISSSASGFANSLLSSAIGEPDAQMVSSTLSGILSGAAAGVVAGPIGAAIGAAIGGAAGLTSGITQIFEAKDDAFTSYVQSAYEEAQSSQAEKLTSGSATAGTRETAGISFSTLLGSAEEASAYLDEVKTLANSTPFLYDDLTSMSKTLLAYGYDSNAMIPTLTSVGDTGAALGMGTSDISMVATALGRMQSTDKASLEYLNLLTERGIGAIDWLAERDGISAGDVYDKISAGDYSGKEVAEFLLEKMNEVYGGSMELQSQTFEGLSSTLEGWTAELENALGSAYNEEAKEGIQSQIDAYSGKLGVYMESANAMIGESQAYMDNLATQYNTEALSNVLTGDATTLDFSEDSLQQLGEYRTAYLEAVDAYNKGDKTAGKDMESILAATQALAENEYSVSDAAMDVVESQDWLIDALQKNTDSTNAYTLAYERNQTLSKGMASTNDAAAQTAEDAYTELGIIPTQDGSYTYHSHATGLNRVPYDDYPALLHADEQVLTASEARSRAAGGIPATVITGNNFTIREEADIKEVAAELEELIRLQRLAGVY